MAVQDAEAPRRQHEQAGPGKEHADDVDGERALIAAKPWRNQVDEDRRRQHAHEHEHRHDQRQQRHDGAGDSIRLFLLSSRQQSRVHGNERRRERALSKQVLQKIRNAKRGVERIRLESQAEVVREDALPDQTRDAAAEDAHRHQQRRAAGGPLWASQGRRLGRPGRACRSTSSSGTT